MPAQIGYALSISKPLTKKITYVGHSQGTMQAFAALSTNQTTASQIDLFVALAPVTDLNHMKAEVLRAAAYLDVAELISVLGFKEFLPSNKFLEKLAPGLCDVADWGCADLLVMLCGPSTDTNKSRIPVYVSQTPVI
jgi:hypothetical protein